MEAIIMVSDHFSFKLAITGFFRVLASLWWVKTRNKNLPSIFSSLVKKHPQKIAFYFEDDAWTFQDVEDFSNKIARYFHNHGFKKGDCIALLLENRPEHPCIWMGLSKIGVITALINTNLVKDSLVHSVKSGKCKAIIFGSNHAAAIKEVTQSLELQKFFQYHETPTPTAELLSNCIDMRHNLYHVSSAPLSVDIPLSFSDPLIYIYTSGTTGFPKAAIVTHLRYIFAPKSLRVLGNFRPDDIMYVPLPFYHTFGNILGIGETLVEGIAVAMRKKFSATNYWKDCVKYKCTVAQYIGEICRYILATPQEEPIQHCVRALCGSGLRSQIWTQLVQRFGIKEVYEVYGATEGISNMINMDGTPGSVGFVPRYLQWAFPIILVKCNKATGEPIRDKKECCIKCEVDEPGLAIAKINQEKPLFNFQGYVDKEATQKKILRDVFRKGDAYFTSGDILMMDEFGNFFFKDRIGDTFRWKGENVSTAEVEARISSLVQLKDVAVYGVEVPNTEGRAGMAAIVDTSSTLDLDHFASALKSTLPAYAIPLFIRVTESLPMTATFRLKKFELRTEGYDVDKIKDKLYFYDSKLGKYTCLTKEMYEQIISGKLRF